jgi:uncharacterized membrane-anchored protein YitT (DUF2179 family)
MGRPRGWTGAYLEMVVGAVFVGFAVSGLIVPARIGDGGLSGLSIVLHFLTGVGVGPLYFVLNLPLLGWAWVGQGFRFLWRTLVGVTLVSGATALFAAVHPRLGLEPLVSALYGGLGIGVGLGLILRAGGSTGGSDIVARHMNLRHGWSYTQTYIVTDLVVLGAVAVWIGLPAAMYGWIVTNVSGRVVSYVLEGPRRGRVALLVTSREDAVAARIFRELDRGATRLRATGVFTGQDRPLLLVALAEREVVHLRRIVAEEDARAFLVVLPAVEVLGEGFWALPGAGGDEP